MQVLIGYILARMIDSPEHAMADAEYILDARGMSNAE